MGGFRKSLFTKGVEAPTSGRVSMPSVTGVLSPSRALPVLVTQTFNFNSLCGTQSRRKQSKMAKVLLETRKVKCYFLFKLRLDFGPFKFYSSLDMEVLLLAWIPSLCLVVAVSTRLYDGGSFPFYWLKGDGFLLAFLHTQMLFSAPLVLLSWQPNKSRCFWKKCKKLQAKLTEKEGK